MRINWHTFKTKYGMIQTNRDEMFQCAIVEVLDDLMKRIENIEKKLGIKNK